ncbi:helix-turn-helix domain-containing protein [Jiulongibacter sp. NS-SX5]|uniref:helix-turn-helix domain-containing protein n=1 Tax=Jiulongibacter sp. NS-SX5 TaxID=3463854 RepID=UPI004058DD77
MSKTLHFLSISDYHKFANLAAPRHPLISLIDYSQLRYPEDIKEYKLITGYYAIGLKRNVPYKFFYGQQEYDFDEGLMTFMAPKQVMHMQENPNIGVAKPSGFLLLIHPDFLWNTTLAAKISSYEFFGYSISEALFLSEKEELMIKDFMQNIRRESDANLDRFSQNIIVSQLELILNYAERFYERQFLTRGKANHQVLEKLENTLTRHFQEEKLVNTGLPTVDQVAAELNLSPNYLSSLLKSLTGMSTQQHIHHKLIEKAKEQLSTTSLSISEIAYDLGFERPASFTKLFKNKTEMSPLEFRSRFN